MSKKITIIGGGSTMFVPHLLRLFMRSALLRGSTICLMDVDAQRLEVMESLGRRLVDREGLDLTIESTTEQRASLAGVDPGEIAMPPLVAGINHCAGIVDVRLKEGSSLMPRIRGRNLQDIAASMQEVFRAADDAMVKQAQDSLGVNPEQLFRMFLHS